jgi:hypothetical protein
MFVKDEMKWNKLKQSKPRRMIICFQLVMYHHGKEELRNKIRAYAGG